MNTGKLEDCLKSLEEKENEIRELKKQLEDVQCLYENASRQSANNYNNFQKCSQAAEYWENRVNHIYNTLSWKLTAPLRVPGHIISELNKKRSDKEDVDLNQKSDEHFNIKTDIKFSIIMPVYNVELKWLKIAVKSILNQTYSNWELCIADDASTDKRIEEYLKSLDNKQIKIRFLEENGGISLASNQAAQMATGEYILLMDNDDEISSDALMEFRKCIEHTNADIIYTDQDIVDENGNHSCPVYKPDWSPDLFLSQMYMGHLIGFRKKLFDEAGGFRKEFDGSQDYDLLLRLIEISDKIEHISKVLYSWRSIPSSTAANPASKPYAQYAALHAIQNHLDKSLGDSKARVMETEDLFVYDVKYSFDENIIISIIIPTKDHAEDLKIAVDSIFAMSSYKKFEIIILNNNSEENETYDYFKEVTEKYDNVRVADAYYEFNWSKLNNHGISIARGDVYLFLNNDVRVLSNDWLERLISQAVRPGVGAVGAMLLYEDGTIQHGGVVIGFGGYADHVYKGMLPIHNGTPYISPIVTRNVSAVTGACMAISRQTIRKIGLFDENFVVCGSDVEICIRAMQNGLVNIYEPHVRLLHYESKSRGTYVSPIDFELSDKIYAPFRNNGDPYYNNNLDYNSFVPKVKNGAVENKGTDQFMLVNIPEITPVHFRKVEIKNKRLNILLPSLNPNDVFGGIATAFNFFCDLQKATGFDARIILTDAVPNARAKMKYGREYSFADSEDDTISHKMIVPFSDRADRTLAVSEKDIFIFTGWWTAYCIQEEYLKWQKEGFSPNSFMYLIQDYEPGFYSWSSLYMLADATYRTKFDQIAIFNSSELKYYFDSLGYKFQKSYVFEPVLNANLRKHLLKIDDYVNKKKQILVYGRPHTERNAFALLVYALRKWVEIQEDAEEWQIVSAGEKHEKVDLGKGMVLKSMGKLTLDEYAKTLKESYAGISLMVSPHPSYPPLEMSVFGARVITNAYANKDLSQFNDNIISLRDARPDHIAKKLQEICAEYTPKKRINTDVNYSYCFKDDNFSFINEIKEYYD